MLNVVMVLPLDTTTTFVTKLLFVHKKDNPLNPNTSHPFKMLLLKTTTTTATTLSAVSLPLLTVSSLHHHHPKPTPFPLTTTKPVTLRHSSTTPKIMNWLGKLGFGTRTPAVSSMDQQSSIAQGPDDDVPAPVNTFQRVPGVTKTEVGYTQGFTDNPTYNDICSGTTNHSEVVRVQFDPKECSYESLLDCFWERHDPTTLNRQGNDVGTQYRSGIYFYTPEQEKAAIESMEKHQNKLNRKIVTEILPAKKFYRAEEYHQQYLAKGGRFGFRQSTEKAKSFHSNSKSVKTLASS
ncbi:putative peptide-methionine (S)-S-oxide reductase [Helianthus annuus]|nr:putative peptide-methionine (S)-S-oxide reductase [Helianthus annuus]